MNKKKYLVIGSTKHQYVDCFDWNFNELPNLVDYDVIIVNVRSITEDFLINISSDRIKEFRNYLIRFLISNGTLIVLTDFLKSGKNKERYPISYNNYAWCPISLEIEMESGDTIKIIHNRFPKYFSKFKTWDYHFYISSSSLSDELTDYFGETSITRYCFPTINYIENRYGGALSFHNTFEIYNERQRHKSYNISYYYPDEPDLKFGHIIWLPHLKSIDSRNSVNLLLEDKLEKPQYSTEPDWAQKIKAKPFREIQTQLTREKGKIDKISGNVAILEKKLSDLNEYKKLLYSDGEELENIFKKCLEAIGAKIEPAKYSNEEYCLVYKRNEYPIEAKGNSKSISLTDLRQLIDYTLVYEDKTGKKTKGILLGNAWKNIPLNQRNIHGKPIFPQNVIDRANSTNIALLSSVDFFEQFCKFLENKSLGRKILKHIVNSTGVINFRTMR